MLFQTFAYLIERMIPVQDQTLEVLFQYKVAIDWELNARTHKALEGNYCRKFFVKPVRRSLPVVHEGMIERTAGNKLEPGLA